MTTYKAPTKPKAGITLGRKPAGPGGTLKSPAVTSKAPAPTGPNVAGYSSESVYRGALKPVGGRRANIGVSAAAKRSRAARAARKDKKG